jgi:hypothetical protein
LQAAVIAKFVLLVIFQIMTFSEAAKPVGAILLMLFLLGTFFMLTIVGDRRAIQSGIALPNGATNIVIVGQDWYEFDYKGQHFLYHRYKLVNDMSECLAVINSSEQK